MPSPFTRLPKATQAALADLFHQYRLHVIEVTRRGPRFVVAVVRYKGQRAVFKMCVFPSSVDTWSGKKFSREVRFLQYLHASKHPLARRMAPGIYAGNTVGRAWYLREYIPGKAFDLGGPIRFRSSFFQTKYLRHILRGFADLQFIEPHHVPDDLRRSFKRDDTVRQAMRFLKPFWGDFERAIGIPGSAPVLQRWLKQRQKVFDALPSALAHHEPYAPHFIWSNGRLRLIDWENINIANPVADGVVLWMRGGDHPRWQAELRRGWRRHWSSLGSRFDLAWETDLVIRSIFTLLSARTYTDKRDMAGLARVAKQSLLAVLRS